MTYLELVQKAVRKSGSTLDEPSTVIDQTGLLFMFVEWVQEAWKEIQLERLGLHFRRDRDLTLSLVASTDEYTLPATLESVNMRSLTCHLAGEEESPVTYQSYQYWRMYIDKYERQEGKPQYFTFGPLGKLIVWPMPNDAYTIRYEGILLPQEFDYEDTAGAGTSNALEPTNLPDQYHDAIVWQAVISYAMHFEDGSKLQEAQAKFKPYKKYFEDRYMDDVPVDTTALYSTYAHGAYTYG
jgi:hypothetical protein